MNLSGLFNRRVIALMIAGFISGGSFALGFFVGKSTVKETAGGPPIIEVKTTAGPQVAVPAEAVKAGKTTSAQTVKAADEKKAYTVQVGAFKERKDAVVLKNAIGSKGYKVSIIPDNGVYKVRAGRFLDRKEAEVSAQRLKKSEGIETFVVPE